MMIRHLAPQRARFRGDELGPSETGIEQARDVALPAEEALAVLHHLVVTPRSVRTVLPAHGFEREVEVGTKAESLGRLQNSTATAQRRADRGVGPRRRASQCTARAVRSR